MGVRYGHRLHDDVKAWDGLWLLTRAACQASDLQHNRPLLLITGCISRLWALQKSERVYILASPSRGPTYRARIECQSVAANAGGRTVAREGAESKKGWVIYTGVSENTGKGQICIGTRLLHSISMPCLESYKFFFSGGKGDHCMSSRSQAISYWSRNKTLTHRTNIAAHEVSELALSVPNSLCFF